MTRKRLLRIMTAALAAGLALTAGFAACDAVVSSDPRQLQPLTLTGDFKITGTAGDNFTGINMNDYVTGGEKPYTFEADGLPPNLVIDPDSGVISGEIKADDSNGEEDGEANITVTDKVGKTAKITIHYTIKPKTGEQGGSDITFADSANKTAEITIPYIITAAIPALTFTDSVGATKSITINYSIAAVNTYTLTYNTNGGTLSGGTPAGSIEYGVRVTLPTSCTREGYTLKDFTLSGALEGKLEQGKTFSIRTFKMPAGDVTVTANWTINSYKLTCIDNGGTLSGGTPVGNIEYGKIVTLPTSGIKKGYILKDFTMSGALTDTKNPGETFTMPAGDVSITANWTDWTTVTYNTNGGTGTTPSLQSVIVGSSVTLASDSGLSKSGYAFAGWNTKSDGTGTNYQAGASFTPTASITLYAKWTLNFYQLSYNGNGGTLSGGTPAGSIEYGAKVTLPTSCTREGYTLKDFTLSGALEGKLEQGETFSIRTFTMPAGDVTVTANWIINFY